MKYHYLVKIRWSEEDNAYVAEAPELPGCATHGNTYEAAVKNLRDAMRTWIEGAKEAGIKIPEPVATKRFSGHFVTRIDPRLHRDLVVKAKSEGKTLSGFVKEVLEEASA